MSRFATTILALLALASPAAAGDWYVDPINGNDANSGTSPTSAWRTLAWAETQVPIGAPETVHLAPGTYAETSTFFVRPRWRVVGDQGSELTILDSMASPAVVLKAELPAHPYSYGPDTELRGLSIRAPDRGVQLLPAHPEMSPTLVDIQVSAGFIGIGLMVSSSSSTSSPTFDRVRISNCVWGVLIQGLGMGGNHAPRFLDCELRDCTNYGINVYTDDSMTVEMKRCRFVNNGLAGVKLGTDSRGLTAVLEDCLIAGGGHGLFAAPFFYPPSPFPTGATLRRCTVADNVVGLSTTGAGFPMLLVLESTIVAHNGDDLNIQQGAQVSYSCIEDGDFAGSNGNFAADPMFVDAASGDYRLRWGSPCVETGDPATAAGVSDLAGHLRPIDGNLDIIERADVGALEFAPLELFTTGQSGSPASFEFWGRQGAACALYYSPQASVPPVATPFGEFELDPATARLRLSTRAGAGPPTTLDWTVPSGAAWIGQTIAFQSLTRSSIAPNGAAFANTVQLTILP